MSNSQAIPSVPRLTVVILGARGVSRALISHTVLHFSHVSLASPLVAAPARLLTKACRERTSDTQGYPA